MKKGIAYALFAIVLMLGLLVGGFSVFAEDGELVHQHEQHLTAVDGTAPTCTADGNEGYYVCSCELYFADSDATSPIEDLAAWKTGAGKIDKIAHVYTEQIKDADHLKEEADSCYEYDTYWYDCATCDANAKDDPLASDKHYASEDAGAHSFGNWVSDGYTHTRICSNDSTHKESADCAGGKAATCTTRSVCDVCDNYYGDKDPTNHKASEPVWVRTATTHAKKYTCCNTFEIAVEAHEWNGGVCTECECPCQHTPDAEDGDCTTPIDCAICGEITTAGKTHDFSSAWETDGESHWHVCQNDGCNEIGDKDVHGGVPANCKSVASCTTCGEQYGNVDPNNHQANAIWKTDAYTHTKAFYDCCGAVEVVEAPHGYDDAKDAVCDACGYTRVLSYIVTFDGNGAEGTMNAVSVADGSYTLPECGFTTPAGKRFGGWKVGGNAVSGDTYEITESITLVAYWETEITSIVIEGFFLPQLGQNTAEYYAALFAKFQDGTIKVNGATMDASKEYLFGNLYLENMVLWDVTTDEQVGESLVAGMYLVDFCFEAVDGYYFADDLTITVLDKANLFVDLMDNEHDCEFSFTQNYGIPEIDRVEISGLPTPLLSDIAENYYDSCVNALETFVRINGQYMNEEGLFGNIYVFETLPLGSDMAELDDDFVFVAGKYYLAVALFPSAGYGFSDDLVVTANGKQVKLYQYYGNVYALIEYELKETVDSIALEGIHAPVIGTTVENYLDWYSYLISDHVFTINGMPYYAGTISVDEVFLLDAEGNRLDYEDVITAGTYSVAFVLKQPTDYTFATPITVTFNGANATVEVLSDGILAYTGMAAVQPTVIDSVEIEGVFVPEVGTTYLDYADAMTAQIKNGAFTINGQKNDFYHKYGSIWNEPSLRNADGEAIMDEDFVFAAGKYYYTDWLYTSYGYVFAENVTVTINGQPVEILQSTEEDRVVRIALYAKNTEAPTSVGVTLSGANVTISGAANMVVGMDYTAALQIATAHLPSLQICVESGDYTMVAGEDYIYDQATGTLTIYYNSVKGPVTITAVATHDDHLTSVAETPASCTTDGNKAYYTCSCGAHFADADATVKIEDLAAWKTDAGKLTAGHSFGAWQAEIPATMDAAGTKAHKDCNVCRKHFDANDNEIAAADLVIPKLAPVPSTSTSAPSTSEPTPDDVPDSEPTPDPITPPSSADAGLSGGAITGIVIGSTATAGISGFAIFWFVIKKKSWAQLLTIFKKKV